MTDIANEDNALKRLIRAANLSQTEVAQRLDVNPPAVSDWNARRKSVGHEKILPLARLLGVDAETIILATEKKPNGEASSGSGYDDADGAREDGERDRKEAG